MQHLLGELLGDFVLELAAGLQQRRQPLRSRPGEQRVLPKEQPQRGADRPPRGLDHVGDFELEPARALAARRRDQTQRVAVEQKPRGDRSVAEQPLHAAVLAGLELVASAWWFVKVGVRVEHAHEQLPGRCVVGRLELADGEVGAQGDAVVRQGELELFGDRRAVDAGVPLR